MTVMIQTVSANDISSPSPKRKRQSGRSLPTAQHQPAKRAQMREETGFSAYSPVRVFAVLHSVLCLGESHITSQAVPMPLERGEGLHPCTELGAQWALTLQARQLRGPPCLSR